MPYAKNKDADQPAHPRSLINAFVVRCRDSTLLTVVTIEISKHSLASVDEQDGLSVTWSETPEDRVSGDGALIILDSSCRF